MALHRDSFISKKDLRDTIRAQHEQLTNLRAERQSLLTEVNRQTSTISVTHKENVKLKTLVTELEGQVQVQSTLVTTARIASQESHQGFAAIKVEYQKAYDRAIALQNEVYALQESNEYLQNIRPWCTKIQEWFIRVTRRPRY